MLMTDIRSIADASDGDIYYPQTHYQAVIGFEKGVKDIVDSSLEDYATKTDVNTIVSKEATSIVDNQVKSIVDDEISSQVKSIVDAEVQSILSTQVTGAIAELKSDYQSLKSTIDTLKSQIDNLQPKNSLTPEEINNVRRWFSE